MSRGFGWASLTRIGQQPQVLDNRVGIPGANNCALGLRILVILKLDAVGRDWYTAGNLYSRVLLVGHGRNTLKLLQ